jgi:hypothetical protein
MRCVIFSGRRPLTLLSSGPCLDPQFGVGTIATVPVSEHCSTFCFLVQKIIQKIIN